jgi:hypothetical protein
MQLIMELEELIIVKLFICCSGKLVDPFFYPKGKWLKKHLK